MLKISKLAVIAVLTGAMALVGCGDDTSSTAGSGGDGGTGGGGMLEACSDGPLADTGETGTGALACVATLPFDLTVRFNATPTGELQEGENEFDLQLEVAIDADTVNEVIDLASDVAVSAVTSSIAPTAGDSDPMSQDIIDEDVPCSLTFEQDMDAVLVTTVSQGTFTLDEGATLELTLEALTQEVEALGIPVTLTTEGDDPSCEFVGEMPSVSFTLP